ncbi:Uncharacterized protein FWK35_00013829 [Aphis craccivora]|uniref:Uncharacterized protein n=1 Tax=Aphis craccivora TaxID=307492 RepID=A0A6G0ZHK0_APHCR|nr:Uncharacterized protein FWK35_00013829 [Aphis craccivora]
MPPPPVWRFSNYNNNMMMMPAAMRLDDNNNLAQSSIPLLMCTQLITIGYWSTRRRRMVRVLSCRSGSRDILLCSANTRRLEPLNIVTSAVIRRSSRSDRDSRKSPRKEYLIRNVSAPQSFGMLLGEHPAAMHHGQGSIPLCPPIISAMIVPFLLIFTARDL